MANSTNLSSTRRNQQRGKASKAKAQSKKLKFNSGMYAQMLFPSVCHLNGWECARPLLEELHYDFVVRGIVHNEFATIQVKQCYYDRNKESFRCDIRKKASGNKKVPYEEGDFDFLAIYNPISDAWYLLPWQSVSHISSEISINDNYSKYRIKVDFPFAGPDLGRIRAKKKRK